MNIHLENFIVTFKQHYVRKHMPRIEAPSIAHFEMDMNWVWTG